MVNARLYGIIACYIMKVIHVILSFCKFFKVDLKPFNSLKA